MPFPQPESTRVSRLTRRPIPGSLAALAAVLFTPVGVLGMKWYVWDVLVVQAGEPDRSMVFWGLPVAMISMSALGAGILGGVGAWWWLIPRRRRAGPAHGDGDGPRT